MNAETICYSKIFTQSARSSSQKLRTCGQHLLCPFCAAIRASRAIQRYVERINQVLQENRKLKPVLITLTVKNGSDLAERSEHLMKSFLERPPRARRDYLKKAGAIVSSVRCRALCTPMKTPSTRKTVEWHPHIHMFALVDQWIDQQEFSEYWHSITGDLMVVDVRRAKKEKGHTTVKQQLLKSVSTLLSSGICPLKRLGSLQGSQG